MGTGISFSLASLLFCIVLNTFYFSKKRLDSVENKIYSLLIMTNLVGLLFEIGCFIGGIYINDYPILSNILLKGYLVYFVIWISLFTLYVYEMTKKSDSVKKYQSFKKLIIFLIILFSFIAIVLPIEIVIQNSARYSTGIGVYSVYFYSSMCIVFWIIKLLLNIKEIKEKKNLPIITFICLGTIVTIIQFLYPGLILITSIETLICFMMFHTIENPDMHLIEQLNIARDQAEKANNAKTDFLSNMSHEIRTPLNAIVGFSQVLLEEDINERAKEEVKDIMMASENLLDIVNGILDISKIEANKLEIINKEYQFSKIIDELISLSKGRIGDKPLEFKVNIDPTIPPVLYGDYTRLKQIILNLLTNAIKYTKEGYVDLKISCVKKDDVCRLIIAVEDSGIGIKSDKIDRLFTKFERFEMDRNTTIEGTGLGLAITKKLVELMKGNIVVQSEYGHGSKFTVAIDQNIILNPEKLEDTATLEKVIDATNKKVLIVDDNKVNLKVATRLLQSYNIIGQEVSSGEECIEKIENREEFDLILLDIMMPGMNGVETLKRLKNIPGFEIPVVALTADAISGMKEKYLSDGFDGYLAKPISKLELNRIVNQFLGK